MATSKTAGSHVLAEVVYHQNNVVEQFGFVGNHNICVSIRLLCDLASGEPELRPHGLICVSKPRRDQKLRNPSVEQ